MRSPVAMSFARLVVVALGLALPAAAQSNVASLYSDLEWRCVGPFDGGPVSAVAGVPGVSGLYTIATPSGGFWKTSDGGQTWTSIDRAAMLPSSADPRLWVDPANPKRIARAEEHGISVSLDGGQIWTAWHNQPIAQTESPADFLLADALRTIGGSPVRVLRRDPLRNSLLFAGTDESVYVSFNDGEKWEPLRLNMPVVSIRNLTIQNNDLVASTYGRSNWILEDISPLRQMTAATASLNAVLFKPADARQQGPDSAVRLDYYLSAVPTGEIQLQIFDGGGRLVHSAASSSTLPADSWVYRGRPLPAAPGEHRIVWDLHMDPPPAQAHRYAQMALALADGSPPAPNGPLVLPGNYKVVLTVAGKTYSQPLTVHGESTASGVAQSQFELALKAYDGMKAAHVVWLQVANVRARLSSLLPAADPNLTQIATDLESRLTALDGSDWNGFVLPDADNGADGDDEEEIRDEVPPLPPSPVALTKDYDDPTTIVGRAFDNIVHPPAFAIVNARLGVLLARIESTSHAPTAADITDYQTSCQQLTGALASWKAITNFDVPLLNRELVKHKLPTISVLGRIPAAPVCR